MPQKKFFRSRAHCNPLAHNDSFHYPTSPIEAISTWNSLYPNFQPSFSDKEELIIRHLDIGMGYGGLTIALAKLYPDKLVLGMEIRIKVCEYVRLRIEALRSENISTRQYQNAACLRTNCMRYLPNYLKKETLEKIFFCFPDPHFKAKNFRRRIISYALLTEYAHFLKPGGRLYTITDVEELHRWHVEKCRSHPSYHQLDDEEVMRDDPAVLAMHEETEEGRKVARLGGKKYFAVFERLETSESQADFMRSPFFALFN